MVGSPETRPGPHAHRDPAPLSSSGNTGEKVGSADGGPVVTEWQSDCGIAGRRKKELAPARPAWRGQAHGHDRGGMHPTLQALDDETPRVQLLRLARRFLGLPG